MQQNPPPSPVKTSSRSKAARSGALLLLLGIALVAFAIYSNIIDNAQFQASLAAAPPIPTGTPDDPNPDAPVTCDNEPMLPGQVCDHILTIGGSSTTTKYTYEEQKVYQQQQRIDRVASDREQQRAALADRQKPIFSLFGCLSTVSCLAGLFLAAVALLTFKGRQPRRKTPVSPSIPNAQG